MMQPEPPPPDKIEPRAPPETPPIWFPDEEPPELPGISPQAPDRDRPDQAPPEMPPPG